MERSDTVDNVEVSHNSLEKFVKHTAEGAQTIIWIPTDLRVQLSPFPLGEIIPVMLLKTLMIKLQLENKML